MTTELSPARRVDRWAEDHLGLITLEAATAFGLTMNQIRERLRSGRWVRVARGVYRVRGAPRTWRQDALAACLAGPHGTVASHITAAALHGLYDPSVLPHVVAPPGTSARLKIARVHKVALDRRDLRRSGVIPCTSPALTVVQCGSVLDRNGLASLVDDAFCRKLTDLGGVRAALGRTATGPGGRGSVLLAQVTEAWERGIKPGSPAEVRLLRLLGEWGYPAPQTQVAVYDASGELIGIIDVAWIERLVGLEYDSPRFHNPRRWERDEARYARLAAAGWSTRQVDKYDLIPGVRGFRTSLERLWVASGGRLAS